MKKLKVEIADTPSKLERGLMYRKSMSEDSGMLFKFPYNHYPSFWMKNTYIPLDIAFLDENGRVLQIETMYPLSTRAIRSNYMCRHALEVPEGWFRKNNITVGSLVIGEGLTHRKGKCVTAQGFMGKLKNVWDRWMKPKDPIDKTVAKPEEKDKEPPKKDNEAMEPPEAAPEGDYPTTLPMEPMESNQQGANPDVEYFRDMRGKIRFAEEHGLSMEIIYWTLRGYMLPPRRVQPIQGKGYPIKMGKNGEYLVAFDVSPTISGGGGWTIKGMQPKSFLMDNIVSLALLDKNGQEIPPETIETLKAKEKGQLPKQPQQPQQTQPLQPLQPLEQPKPETEQPQASIDSKIKPFPLNSNKPMPRLQERIKGFEKVSANNQEKDLRENI